MEITAQQFNRAAGELISQKFNSSVLKTVNQSRQYNNMPPLKDMKEVGDQVSSFAKSADNTLKEIDGVFSKVGGFFRGVAGSFGDLLKGIVNPKKWFTTSFWRDTVLPVVLDFIPGIGPILSEAYQFGLTAYKWGRAVYLGVESVVDFAQGKVVEGLSRLSGTLHDLSDLTEGTLSKVSQKVSTWMDRGLYVFQKTRSLW